MNFKNTRGITLIALVVTIIVLVIIAGVSIASLTSDNGVLRQTNTAKVEQIEGTAREQVKLAVSALRVAIAEASSQDNSYKANNNAGKIQAKLVEILNQDKSGLNGEFGFGGNDLDDNAKETKLRLSYTGDDYQNACNFASAEIIYIITLGQKSIEVTGEISAILKDQNENDVTIEVLTPKPLTEVAKIGDYVNYDPTTGGNVNSTNTTYTSMPGNTSEHGNGYTAFADGQTFSAKAYKNAGGKWRILNIEGETITLISDLIYRDNEEGTVMMNAFYANGFYLSNGIGYLWAEEELHRIAAIYGHGDGADLTQTVTYYYGGPNDQDGSITAGTAEAQQGRKTTLNLDTPSGARSLTIHDINKIFGMDSTYTVNYSEKSVAKTSNNSKYYPTLNGTSTNGQSSEVSSPSGSFYYTYYDYTLKTDTPDRITQQTILKNNKECWLASRCSTVSANYLHYFVRRLSLRSYDQRKWPMLLI